MLSKNLMTSQKIDNGEVFSPPKIRKIEPENLDWEDEFGLVKAS